MFKKNNILIVPFITCMVVMLYAGMPSASDTPSSPETPEQIESLNAIMEQVFSNLPQRGDRVAQSLVDKVSNGKRIPVIVRLREGELPYGLFSDKKRPRPEVINSLQTTVLEDVIKQAAADQSKLQTKRLSIIPAMGLQVNASELEALLSHPNVIDIVEDKPVPPTLLDSVPLIGADPDGSFSGYTGLGQTVAILDTGVDKNHPFLSGKVVSEACYSSNVPALNATSVCPGGVEESIANDSGLPCDSSIPSCDHGTHVAGIAAGALGVASDASIIAVQVFSRFDGADACDPYPSPCSKSFTIDQMLGLQRVYELRNYYSIASVNMSLGGGEYTTFCNTEDITPDIDLLRSADIATVVASGNNGFENAISSPACVESAVSVGNTNKVDAVNESSNSADILSLLAPGTFIESSVPGGGYEFKTGTSMAAPHVAGAWAVIKEANPDASVTDVLSALQQSGVPIADWRSGTGYRVKSRIDVQAALEQMQEGCLINADCDDGIFCNGGEMCAGGECVSGTDPCEADEYCDETVDQCFCDIPWDLNRDCYVDKDDSKILKIQQKIEKIELKIKHKEEKEFIKTYMGYYISPCGAGPDLNGDCYVDKDDAKLLKLWQKAEKTYYKIKHKEEKDAMKAAIQ